MPAPYDYTLGQVPNPAQSFLQGIQAVDALRQREEKMAAAEQAKIIERQRQEAAAQLAEKIRSRTVTRGDYEAAMMANPKEYQAYKTAIDSLESEQKNNLFARGMPLYSALFKNTPESLKVAEQLIATDLQAAENRKDAVQVQQITMMRDLLKNNQVDALMGQVGAVMQSIDPERFEKGSSELRKMQEQPYALRKTIAQTEKLENDVKEAEIKLRRLDAIQAAELDKAQSLADQELVKAKFADRMANADLALKNAQRNREEYQLTSLKADADKGPTPVFNAQAGGFVVAPTASNPKGGFIPLNAIADNQQQQSAVKALKVAGYDPVTGEDRISKLIEKSTGGVAQAIGTEALRAFGFTTEGRKAINELESSANAITLAMSDGKLGAGVSNADIQFILSQLGDVANPKKPAEERLAGWTAAKNRMITSGMLPPPTGQKQPSKAQTPSAQPSNYQNMSDAELMQLLRK